MTKIELEAKIVELEAQLKASKDEEFKLITHVEELSTIIQKEITDKVVANNVVVLDGISYGIIHRNTVKGLALEDYRKHFVDENLTAVVIRKYGG
jgi:hypothetical protein